MGLDLDDLKTAAAAGRDLDLSAARYNPSGTRPEPYYPFLAGFAETQEIQTVLEIGTHTGGSALALAAGMRDRPRPILVTVDVAARAPSLAGHPSIIPVVGDALADRTVRRVGRTLAAPIDLLYIDALHDRWPTEAYVGLYANLLRPKFIILDDIRLCPSMRSAWGRLKAQCAGPSFDVSELANRPRPGFGLLDNRPATRWREPLPLERAVLRRAYQLRFQLAGYLPRNAKTKLREWFGQGPSGASS